MYKRMMTGARPLLDAPVRDITLREKLVVAPLIAAFLVLGFYPKPALDMLNPAVSTTLQFVGVTDPAPTAPTSAADGSTK
jgi:NADH-quinone oxidoreductase subunit M